MTPAVTIIHTHGGGAVQIAGLDTPLEQQVDALQEMGRLNAPGVPGALRGEVWTNGGRVAASTFFECSPVEPVAPAPGAFVPDIVAEISAEVPAEIAAEIAAEISADNSGAPEAPASPPLTGKKKTT